MAAKLSAVVFCLSILYKVKGFIQFPNILNSSKKLTGFFLYSNVKLSCIDMCNVRYLKSFYFCPHKPLFNCLSARPLG